MGLPGVVERKDDDVENGEVEEDDSVEVERSVEELDKSDPERDLERESLLRGLSLLFRRLSAACFECCERER